MERILIRAKAMMDPIESEIRGGMIELRCRDERFRKRSQTRRGVRRRMCCSLEKERRESCICSRTNEERRGENIVNVRLGVGEK